MKKIISLLLTVVFIILPFTVCASSPSVNLLRENLLAKKGIVMTVSNGNVSDNNRFDGNGALATVNDGDEVTRTDIYGALDWDPPRYVGVLFTLNDVCYAEDIEIISGYPSLIDTYRVYASDSISNLYTQGNIVANEIACNGTEQTAAIGKNVQYIAVFGITYNGNLRLAEIKVNGRLPEIDPTALTAADYAAGLSVEGNTLRIGDKPVALQGANIPHFSWSNNGDGSDASIALNDAINDFGCKIVRLAVNPNYYVNGGTYKNTYKSAEQYRAYIDSFINELTAAKIAVVLDCHAYSGVYDTVVSFWDIAAPLYDSNELVMYDLVNEPISTWEIWYEGGDIILPDADSTQTHSIGMPALIDRIRAVSDNVIVLGGINWAYDLSGISVSSFNALAAERAAALGISEADYAAAYSVREPSRKGRGIMLSTHIYGSDEKHYTSMNWEASYGGVKGEFPILVGEYNPYFRNGQIDELNEKEIAFFQKIFKAINENGFSSTAWALGAEPFLTSHNGTISALGETVREFIATGGCTSLNGPENVLYQRFSAAYGVIVSKTNQNNIIQNSGFINQAYRDGNKVGNAIIARLVDGENTTHYDIYPYDDWYLGMVYAVNGRYPCYRISITSGLSGYPDRYRIYASDNRNTLFNSENMIENFSVSMSGDTVSFNIDRPVTYVAFIAEGYVRIKEITLEGTMFGDMNTDSALDGADMLLLRQYLLGHDVPFTSASDANENGISDIIDLVSLKKKAIK
ncbi:MAG: cellulase family glycosylhydrolase [Clostridia bacterium]|nr:cellulase family glycosylhydrolase [Clostridia bacterium]